MQQFVILALILALSDVHEEQAAQQALVHIQPKKTLQTPPHTPHQVPAKQPQPTPKNSIILFDLHGVLFHLDLPQAALTWIKNCSTILKRFKQLHKKYPTCMQAFKDASAPSANCQIPQELVWNLIKHLKEHGYTVILCSGILPETFADLRNKHPEKFALFDGYITTGHDSHFVKKDTDAFFKYTRNKLEALGHFGKTVYLFDDTKSVINKAQEHGIHAKRVQSEKEVLTAARQFGLPVPA